MKRIIALVSVILFLMMATVSFAETASTEWEKIVEKLGIIDSFVINNTSVEKSGDTVTIKGGKVQNVVIEDMLEDRCTYVFDNVTIVGNPIHVNASIGKHYGITILDSVLIQTEDGIGPQRRSIKLRANGGYIDAIIQADTNGIIASSRGAGLISINNSGRISDQLWIGSNYSSTVSAVNTGDCTDLQIWGDCSGISEVVNEGDISGEIHVNIYDNCKANIKNNGQVGKVISTLAGKESSIYFENNTDTPSLTIDAQDKTNITFVNNGNITNSKMNDFDDWHENYKVYLGVDASSRIIIKGEGRIYPGMSCTNPYTHSKYDTPINAESVEYIIRTKQHLKNKDDVKEIAESIIANQIKIDYSSILTHENQDQIRVTAYYLNQDKDTEYITYSFSQYVSEREDTPTVDLPQTGDRSRIGLWIVLLTLTGIALFSLKRKTA